MTSRYTLVGLYFPITLYTKVYRPDNPTLRRHNRGRLFRVRHPVFAKALELTIQTHSQR
jgi:hypothetical protein